MHQVIANYVPPTLVPYYSESATTTIIDDDEAQVPEAKRATGWLEVFLLMLFLR